MLFPKNLNTYKNGLFKVRIVNDNEWGDGVKPVIGVTGNFDDLEGNYLLKEYYVLSLYNAGGVPVILPPVDDDSLIEGYVDVCQGFVFSGGGDIDPYYWGELPQQRLGQINPLRDRFELTLARKIIERRLPVLGICRGCQVLNVAAGGSLFQHILSSMSHHQKAPRSYPFHEVIINEGSRLGKIVGSRKIRVNSFHHQAVKETGEGIYISARAIDGIIEAIESVAPFFFLGVQWHPECMSDISSLNLFKALVNAARQIKRENMT